VVDAHHDAAAHADQRQHWRQLAALGPDEHHADFHLGRPVRSLDYRLEMHALLKNVVVALVRRNRVDVRLRRRELDSHSGKRIQRLKQIVLVVRRQFAKLIEEPGLRNARMLQIRNGELADAEIPVRMASPFDIDLLAQIEG
jgi:hypothetical protein